MWERRRLVGASVGVGVTTMGLHTGVGLLLASAFLRPVRVPIRRSPADLGLAHEAVSLTSADGTRLAAWYVPKPGARAAVVLCHGYPMNREDVLGLIAPLHRAGFHVLAFDFRAMGESGGSICTFGKEESADVIAGVNYLRSQPEVDPGRVGVLGWSMGAASALLAATQAPSIRAVVADSAFARLDEMIAERLRFVPWPLRTPLARSTQGWAERLAGFDAASVAPEAVVRRIAPRPLLLIHGERDGLIPVAHARRLHKATASTAALWLVPGADHVQAHAELGGEYERRVVAFFRDALAADRSEAKEE